MQDLHADVSTFSVYRRRDTLMIGQLTLAFQGSGSLEYRPFRVRCNSAGDDQADALTGPLGVKHRQPLESTRSPFEIGMHGAHQHTVGQRQMTHLERLKKMRIAHAELLLGRVTGISNNCMIVERKAQKKNLLRNQYEKTPEPKLGGLSFDGGPDGARTRDLRRDRPCQPESVNRPYFTTIDFKGFYPKPSAFQAGAD